jgi:hypothetical protein
MGAFIQGLSDVDKMEKSEIIETLGLKLDEPTSETKSNIDKLLKGEFSKAETTAKDKKPTTPAEKKKADAEKPAGQRQTDGIAKGTLKKGTKIYSTKHGKAYTMTRDHETSFNHKVKGMCTFDWQDDTYYVSSKEVHDYDDGSIMKEEKKEIKKASTAKELNEAEGSKFVYEKYMDKCLGKSRDEMPQVDESNLDDFLIHYSKNATVKKYKRKLNTLKPTQNEINEEKVSKMMEDKKEGWRKRKYIVSLDGHILDGHHSWAAGLEKDEEAEVDVYRVNVPIKKLVTRTNRMKIAKKADIAGKDIKKAEEIIQLIADNPQRYSEIQVRRAKVYLACKD